MALGSLGSPASLLVSVCWCLGYMVGEVVMDMVGEVMDMIGEMMDIVGEMMDQTGEA